MTTSVTRTRVPRLPLRVALAWSIAISLMATTVLIALLAIRMADGRDPALGPKAAIGSADTKTAPSVASLPSPGAMTAAPPAQPVQTTTS